MIDLSQIDNNWTLFLDRDGVINHEKDKDYIHTWDEFIFYEGVTEAISIFTKRFKHILVVTNQKGVGKGLTKLEDLTIIHNNMLAAIAAAGGKVDKVYFSPELEQTHPDRKPNPGMGLKAKKDFPGINLNKAIMVGNKFSDMEFGRNLGIKTIFLTTTNPETDINDPRIDAAYPSLIAFAKAL